VRIKPDKLKAAELNVPIQRLANVINVYVGGMRNGRFTDLDKRYDVRLRLMEDQRASPDHTENVYVRSDMGKLVPLSDLTTRETIATLPVINRYNHLRKVEITANMAPDVAQGDAIVRSHEIAEETKELEIEDIKARFANLREKLRSEITDPDKLEAAERRLEREQQEEEAKVRGIRIVPMGNAQAMKTTINSMWWALALGFVIAYMILGVQFNSFVHPFTVLAAVPFGVTGALATLWLTGDTLNLMSMIGMVLLAGLVKKNSIILVDYANQLRAEGMGPRDAMLAAGPVRLRPIIMTSLATMAAAVPLALGYGPGAETRAPLARSIIGGIILSTLVTLVIVPVLYVLFDRFGAWVGAQTKREPQRLRDTEKTSNAEANRQPASETEGAVFSPS
jgi:multidrug efflux pump subunit AcrB